jgi:hypothetical protein
MRVKIGITERDISLTLKAMDDLSSLIFLDALLAEKVIARKPDWLPLGII